MSDTPTTPAEWYPDPCGRHELRYWDGAQWTDHVSSHGRQATDPVVDPARQIVGSESPERVRAQVDKHAAASARRGSGHVPGFAGDGTIWGEPILVVNQKPKLIEVNSEYAIYDQNGNQLGAVRQVGQSTGKKMMRLLGNMDQFFTHKLQVVDMSGNVLIQVSRPAKFVKSRVVITDAVGGEVGEVRQENVVGKIRFGFIAGGQRIGGIQAENWRAWNFSVRDETDTEVARITKTFEGVAKTMFTTADNYVIQSHRPLEDPLRTLVIASALSVDTALKQDSRGLS